MTRSLPALLLLGVLVAACASTDTEVTRKRGSNQALPYPGRILVYDFAVSLEDVDLDSSVGKEIARGATARPVDEEKSELAIGVAEVVAEKLTAEAIVELLEPRFVAQGWMKD